MFKSLVRFIEGFNPMTEYSVGFVRDYNWDDLEILAGLAQGPVRGEWVVWACHGDVALGEYRREQDARAHLQRIRDKHCSMLGLLRYNFCRLAGLLIVFAGRIRRWLNPHDLWA